MSSNMKNYQRVGSSPEKDQSRKKSSHKVKRAQPSADNYINKELSKPGQEYDVNSIQEAKRILDENISYLSKDCYMRLNLDILQNKNPETVRVLRAFKNHHSVDLLVRNCMLLYNENEYNKMVNKN